jgi:hypothetical protein
MNITQRITNEGKQVALAVLAQNNIPVAYDQDGLFVFGPHPDDGTYAVGEQQGENGDWVVRLSIPGNHPMMRMVLALVRLETALSL